MNIARCFWTINKGFKSEILKHTFTSGFRILHSLYFPKVHNIGMQILLTLTVYFFLRMFRHSDLTHCQSLTCLFHLDSTQCWFLNFIFKSKWLLYSSFAISSCAIISIFYFFAASSSGREHDITILNSGQITQSIHVHLSFIFIACILQWKYWPFNVKVIILCKHLNDFAWHFKPALMLLSTKIHTYKILLSPFTTIPSQKELIFSINYFVNNKNDFFFSKFQF